ncbi:MAG: hypothetical protein GY803_31770 [Chloroflexi bacterium]|nr:hypothetical protein [Chloroflexota bacterium]
MRTWIGIEHQKLPIEHSAKQAFMIYAKLLGAMLLVAAANILLLLSMSLPQSVTILVGIAVIALIVLLNRKEMNDAILSSFSIQRRIESSGHLGWSAQQQKRLLDVERTGKELATKLMEAELRLRQLENERAELVAGLAKNRRLLERMAKFEDQMKARGAKAIGVKAIGVDVVAGGDDVYVITEDGIKPVEVKSRGRPIKRFGPRKRGVSKRRLPRKRPGFDE